MEEEIKELILWLAECPYVIDSATLPKSGVTEENKKQVVGTLSLSLVKYEKLVEIANKLKQDGTNN